MPVVDTLGDKAKGEKLYRVEAISDPVTLELEGGLRARLLGVKVIDCPGTMAYLKRYVSGKRVFLKPDSGLSNADGSVCAYVYLKNRIFVNAYLIKSGLCVPDPAVNHRLSAAFKHMAQV
jgi:hypothetical protein